MSAKFHGLWLLNIQMKLELRLYEKSDGDITLCYHETLKYFLQPRYEILRHYRSGIVVSQKHYAQKLLERFGMSDCKAVNTPIIKEAQTDSEKENDVKFPYREAVGALAYLMTASRPDISYAVSFVSRSLANPTTEDVQKVKRIFRYIKGTIDSGIVYKKDYKSGILECYSDADHGGDPSTGRSTSGILCMYAGGVIAWASRKQTSVLEIATDVLEGKENWTTWRCKVLLMLRGTAGCLDAINGNLNKPKEPDSTASAEDFDSYQKALRTYNEINNTLIGESPVKPLLFRKK